MCITIAILKPLFEYIIINSKYIRIHYKYVYSIQFAGHNNKHIVILKEIVLSIKRIELDCRVEKICL